MSSVELEDRLSATLQRWADDVSAPPGPTARERVARRAGRLRHRRQVGRALGGAALAATVAGSAAWLGLPGSEVETTPGDEQPTGTSLPALPPGQALLPEIEVDGYTAVGARDSTTPDVLGDSGLPKLPHTEQVYARPGDYTGPLALVTYGIADDLHIRESGQPGTDRVDINGASAYATSGLGMLLWEVDDEHGVVVQSLGLTETEVLAFARGLTLRADGSGVDATVLPAGMAEALTPPDQPAYVSREITLQSDVGEQRTMVITRSGERGFLGELFADRLGVFEGLTVDPVTVLGRAGVVLHYPGDDEWTVFWRHNEWDWVHFVVRNTTADGIEQELAGLRDG